MLFGGVSYFKIVNWEIMDRQLYLIWQSIGSQFKLIVDDDGKDKINELLLDAIAKYHEAVHGSVKCAYIVGRSITGTTSFKLNDYNFVITNVASLCKHDDKDTYEIYYMDYEITYMNMVSTFLYMIPTYIINMSVKYIQGVSLKEVNYYEQQLSLHIKNAVNRINMLYSVVSGLQKKYSCSYADEYQEFGNNIIKLLKSIKKNNISDKDKKSEMCNILTSIIDKDTSKLKSYKLHMDMYWQLKNMALAYVETLNIETQLFTSLYSVKVFYKTEEYQIKKIANEITACSLSLFLKNTIVYNVGYYRSFECIEQIFRYERNNLDNDIDTILSPDTAIMHNKPEMFFITDEESLLQLSKPTIHEKKKIAIR